MKIEIGDTVWVDEGDGAGCYEFRGVVEQIEGSVLGIRVNSNPIGPGAVPGTLRWADSSLVFEHTAAMAR